MVSFDATFMLISEITFPLRMTLSSFVLGGTFLPLKVVWRGCSP